jgi:hypothetical protein
VEVAHVREEWERLRNGLSTGSTWKRFRCVVNVKNKASRAESFQAPTSGVRQGSGGRTCPTLPLLRGVVGMSLIRMNVGSAKNPS